MKTCQTKQNRQKIRSYKKEQFCTRQQGLMKEKLIHFTSWILDFLIKKLMYIIQILLFEYFFSKLNNDQQFVRAYPCFCWAQFWKSQQYNYNYLNQSTMADQAQFYQLIDSSIKQGLNQQNIPLLIQNCNQNQSIGTLFDLPANVQYALRRFINACMSTDPQIREQSYEALQKWVSCFEVKPKQQKLIKYILETSNYKKAVNRKSEAQAFAAGRILVVKALKNIIKSYSNIFQSLVQIIKDYPHLEQEAIQTCHLISNDKVLKLKFQNLSPQNKCAKFLYKIFLRIKDPKNEAINMEQFKEILQIETLSYPKKSIVLYNFGKYIHTVLDAPNQFFRQYANIFLDNESEKEVDIHEIYSIMTILKGFLDNTVITQQNYKTHFDKRIVAVWLEQFRVLNKKMKGLAKNIKISFEQNNPEFAYQVLVDIHEEGIYIDNISVHHPLGKLFEWVDVNKYWQYIFNLCTIKSVNVIKEEKSEKKSNKNEKSKKKQKEQKQQEQAEEQEQEQQIKTYFNELQYLIKLRFKQLADEHICKTIVLFLNDYEQRQKNKQMMYLCVNLFNMICKIPKNKKKQDHKKLNKKMMLVISKLQLSQLPNLKEDPQKIKEFKRCIAWVKKNTINVRKQEGYVASSAQINFFNFYNAMLFYCILYPDQIQTCSELQLVYKDLLALYANKIQQSKVSEPKPTKKVKKQKGIKLEEQDAEQKNKPIHVLNDIFISLMTKPPLFLRKSIHNLFENIIPYLDENDIGNMLAVITTPDAEFIQEI